MKAPFDEMQENYDSKGRQLTAEQQEYFKYRKVRDDQAAGNMTSERGTMDARYSEKEDKRYDQSGGSRTQETFQQSESLNKEETARYRELLEKEMEEDLYMGDQTS